MNIDEKIKTLEEQSEQAKTLWTKCQGALEILRVMKDEETAKEPEKPLADSDEK